MKKYLLLAVVIASGAVVLLSPQHAEAASMTVAAGTDTVASDSVCGLSEAIENLNDQANTNADCTASGSYGSSDTIHLSAGTITTPGLQCIKKSVIVQGAGVGQTNIEISALDPFFAFGVCGGIGEYSDPELLTADITYVQKDMTFIGGTAGVLIFVSDSDGPTNSSFTVERVSTYNSIYGIYPIAELSHEESHASLNMTDISIETADDGEVHAYYAGYFPLSPRFDINVDRYATKGPFYAGVVAGVADNEIVGPRNFSLSNATLNGGAAPLYIGINGQQNTINLRNITIANQTSTTGFGPQARGFLIGTEEEVDPVALTVNMQNLLIANINSDNCASTDDLSWVTLNSLGGNFSDDASCNDYFTAGTDKNNITALGASLGEFGEHGGNVPTLPLLAESPAVDAGVCADAPTTDARGIARPQGVSCDSGAYELVQGDDPSDGSIPNAADGEKVYFTAPEGSTLTSFTSIAANDVAVDSGHVSYTYPLGLVSFTLSDVEVGSSKQVDLYFTTSLKPVDVTPRKYNTSTKAFQDIPGVVVTAAKKDGKPALKVTYMIQDGGVLDQDANANGIIVDPLGLAVENKGLLANTGIVAGLAIPVGFLMIGTALYTYIDYRRHKRPLLDAEPEIARSYTYWHHLRVVSIPLLKYRLTVRIEKKERIPTLSA